MRWLALALAAMSLGAQSPPEPARIRTFEVIPLAVNAGDPVELRWVVTGADSVRLDPLEQDFPPTGHTTYVPRERTVFWLHASNPRGGQSIPLTVEVLPKLGPSPVPVVVEIPPAPAGLPVVQRGIWIQLAALADLAGAERLSQEVLKRTGAMVVRTEIEAPGRPEQKLQRLRIGPYASIREARTHLRTLNAKLKSLHLQPIVAIN